MCGTAAEGDDVPVGWSTASSERGVQWLCPACTREHVRSIEAKLEQEWW